MIRRMIAGAIGFAALTAATGAFAADSLKLETEDFAPFNYQDKGVITGISVQLLQMAADKAGIKISMAVLPWQRAYGDALANADTCVFSTTVTDARRPLFKWVTPVTYDHWALLSRADSPIVLKSLNDAKPYTIGVYQGDARDIYLTQAGGFKLAPVAEDDLNPKKLLAGRIDLWANSGFAVWNQKRLGVSNIKIALTFRDVELGLACNKGVPDATIAAFNKALAEVRAGGAEEKLIAQYN